VEPAAGAAFPPVTAARLAAFAEEQFAPLCFREHTIEQVFQDKALFSAQLNYLAEMGKLAADLDLKVLLNKIMELTMEFAGADVGSLILLEDDQPVTKLDWGLPHEALLALTDPEGEPLIFRAIDRPEPVWLDERGFRVPPQLPYRFRAVAILPLRTRDSWLGAVCLVASAPNPEFHAGKLDGLGAGLSLAATAVENARLFQVKAERERELRNMEIAGEIQKALLPRAIPDLQGVSVVGTNVAARTIGGDYYDFFPFADGSLGLIVADVAGKGVAASLIMTSTRMLVRSIAADDVPVEDVMRRTNVMLQAEACGGQFVTANYVRVDPRRLVMEVCTAGHEPVFVYRPREDRFICAQSRALPLGITPDAAYARETIPLEPEDLIFLYTDGVNEAMNHEREQFGLQRLQETIRGAYPDTIEAVMNTILTAVDWHSAGMPRHDDTTIVVAQVQAAAGATPRGGVVADDNGQP
jgi:serine phosphatase RsbU (regulator of sigma subunit)